MYRRGEELSSRRPVRVLQVGAVRGDDERLDAGEVVHVASVVEVVGGDDAVRAARRRPQHRVEGAPLLRLRPRLLVADGRDDEHAAVERDERLAHRDRQRADERGDDRHLGVGAVSLVELTLDVGRQTNGGVAREDAQARRARANTAHGGRNEMRDMHRQGQHAIGKYFVHVVSWKSKRYVNGKRLKVSGKKSPINITGVRLLKPQK